jgi:hypothetical protein
MLMVLARQAIEGEGVFDRFLGPVDKLLITVAPFGDPGGEIASGLLDRSAVIDPPAADPQQQPDITPDAPRALRCPCPRCGARMIVIEVFAAGCQPRWRPTPSTIDTS